MPIWGLVLSVPPRAQRALLLISTLNSSLGVLKISSCSGSWFHPCRGGWQVTICSWYTPPRGFVGSQQELKIRGAVGEGSEASNLRPIRGTAGPSWCKATSKSFQCSGCRVKGQVGIVVLEAPSEDNGGQMGYLFKEFWKCGWEARQRRDPGTKGAWMGRVEIRSVSSDFCFGPIVAKIIYQSLVVCICPYLLIPGEVWTALKIVGPLFPAEKLWLGKGPRLKVLLWKMWDGISLSLSQGT